MGYLAVAVYLGVLLRLAVGGTSYSPRLEAAGSEPQPSRTDTAVAAANDRRLLEAVRNQDARAVAALLKQHVDVDTPAPDGATALHWAAYLDDLDTADLLIKAGARVSPANEYCVTPLILACTNGSIRMVEKLLKAGADPNASLPSGETALMTTAHTGNRAILELLLARGANVNAKETFKGQSALMWALSERHVELARVLVAHGADVHARSDSGFTPLMFAVREGDFDAVRLLLAAGAKVNDRMEDGTSVLLVATVRGHSELAQFLLAQGADPNIAGPGYAALHWAVGVWESFSAHDYPTDSGELSAIRGVRKGKLELIKALLAHGADPNARTEKSPPRMSNTGIPAKYAVGATPFYFATSSGDVDVMRVLVANGADPSLSSETHVTPVMIAAGIAFRDSEAIVPESSRLETIRLALELGVDINAVDEDGNTALHAAAYAGHDMLVQFLVDRGAQLNRKNKAGQTPLRVALGNADTDVFAVERPSTAALLRRLGALSD